MRSLTASEARVIQTLLEGGAATEVDLIDRSTVPRSTFQYVRRRAYARGWLFDRYIPGPGLSRARTLTAALVWTFADRRAEFLRGCTEDPRVVLVWSWPNVAFVLRFETGVTPTPGSPLLRGGTERAGRTLAVGATVDEESVPVFLDASGALSRLFGLRKPSSFPIGLPRPLPPARHDAGGETSSARLLGGARQFLARIESPGVGLFHRVVPPIPWTLPRSEAALVERNQLMWRVLPRLEQIPAFQGRAPNDLVFVHGAMSARIGGRRLLEELVSECGTLPYLLMVGSESPAKVLLAFLALGSIEPTAGGPTLRSSVQRFLSARLTKMAVVREPLRAMTATVDHRFQGIIAS